MFRRICLGRYITEMRTRFRLMRFLVSIIAVLFYVSLFNVYVVILTISTHYAHLLYNYLTLLAMIFFYFNQFSNDERISCVNVTFGLCILCNFLLLILHWHGIINDSRSMFYTFNGLVFAVTIIHLVSGKRYGYFKNK